jgi:serine/threonine protein kinase
MRAAGFPIDIFAFGVLAYQLLAGRAPFDAAARLAMVEPEAVRSLGDAVPGLPADLIALVDESLAWSPSLRPTSAQLVARLDAIGKLPSHTRLPTAVTTLARGSDEMPTVRAATPEPARVISQRECDARPIDEQVPRLD